MKAFFQNFAAILQILGGIVLLGLLAAAIIVAVLGIGLILYMALQPVIGYVIGSAMIIIAIALVGAAYITFIAD